MIDSNETIIYENGYDAGYAKDVDDTLNHIIDKLQLNNGDIILCRYDMYKDDVATVEHAVKYLSKICPEYQVVAIPNSLSLQNCTIIELERCIKYISDIIEKQKKIGD